MLRRTEMAMATLTMDYTRRSTATARLKGRVQTMGTIVGGEEVSLSAAPSSLSSPIAPAPASGSQDASSARDKRNAQAAAFIEDWRVRWPGAFSDPPKPLAIGIHSAIRAAMPDVSATAVHAALRWWTGRRAYQRALTEAGAARINLAGEMVSPVTEAPRLGGGTVEAGMTRSTVSNDPRLKANRHPWNRNPSTAREMIEGFLAAAQRRMDLGPETLPFPKDQGTFVLAWLRIRLDTPPGS